jgi:hypothetical protein
MKPFLIIASINELNNLQPLVEELKSTGTKVIVVDEGNMSIRERNRKLLTDVDVRYFGSVERTSWFKGKFGSDYEKYLAIIPERAHAETSFGFLVAYEEGADFIIELDDDVFINSLVPGHQYNLYGNKGTTVSSPSRWYNTLDAIEMDTPGKFFPRGHPYDSATRTEEYQWKDAGGECILNMGHWLGNPDFDAMTILYHGGMDGRCGVKGTELKKEKVIVDYRTYFAVCSMNTSFRREAVPAMYQLYMNTMSIDRFDDIWSGIFLKRIADLFGDKVCLGKPAGTHDKRPRNVFKDLKKEMDGMVLNETLWQMIDGDISGHCYSDAYISMVDMLEKNLANIADESYRKFMQLQAGNMRLWVDIVDTL